MKVLYAIFTAIAWIIARFPFPLLYGFSDFICLILYYVVAYRKKVVFTNLHNAFPEKNKTEIRRIAKSFYRNLSDLMVEIIKTETITKEQLAERIHIINLEVAEDILHKGKSVICLLGHCGNWEWMGVHLSRKTDYHPFAVVKPMSDKFFENFVNDRRQKYRHDALIDFRQTYREMIRYKKEVCLTLIASDQTPMKEEINYWTTFLNQDTPVFLGTEKIAKTLDQAVVFFDLQRKKRGFYEIRLSLITEFPKETADFEITEAHVRMLEKAIRAHPDNWLWSHRRWKHKKEE